jgi:hypothetical protein
MSKKTMLTALAAVAIAAASFTVSTGGALAATQAPHYKPLICIFLPSLCRDSMAMATPVHKTAMVTNKPMMAKPVMAPKKY